MQYVHSQHTIICPIAPIKKIVILILQIMKMIALICPECGGELEIPADLSKVHCMYCGTQFIVPAQPKKTESIKTLVELCKTALKAKNYQQAIKYSGDILEIDSKNVEAWIDKALSTFMASNSVSIYDESVVYLKKAYAIDPKHPKIKKTLDDIVTMQTNWLNKLGIKTFERAKERYGQLSGGISSISLEGLAYKAAAVADAKSETADDFLEAMNYYLLAAGYSPSNEAILQNISHLVNHAKWLDWEKVTGVRVNLSMLDIITTKTKAEKNLSERNKELTTTKKKLMKVKGKDGFLAGLQLKSRESKIDELNKDISKLKELANINLPVFVQSLD